jgi:hypothetical protein
MQSSRWMRLLILVVVFAAGVVVSTLSSETVVARLQRPSSDDMQRAAALDVLLAKDEISQQIYNYSRALDRMDKDLALQMMHPDGKWTGGTREAFVKGAWDINGTFATHSHQMTNSAIKVTGDKAVSETYGWVPLRRPSKEGDKDLTTEIYVTRYLDRWSKRNGRWALDERQLVVDMHLTVQEELKNASQRVSNGRRDKTDPSYRFLPY